MQLMMQIKFNFNTFACFATAWQRTCQRHTPSSLVAVIGLSNNEVISSRSLLSLRCVRHFIISSIRCVRCVGWNPASLGVIRELAARESAVIKKSFITLT